MKLLIVSHTPHIKSNQGYYGWSPTVQEMNYLARFFDITQIAPVTADAVPMSFALVDQAIEIIPTRNRGGVTLLSKLKVLIDSFQYAFLIFKQARKADVVHVRCPANISLIALLVLVLFPQKMKWIKYAGDWRPQNDFWSYQLQRFLLRHALRNQIVTINGKYQNEKTCIHSMLNPSYFSQEIQADNQVEKSLSQLPITILFVGGLTPNKGADIVIQAVALLHQRGFPVQLNIVGDGSEHGKLVDLVRTLNLKDIVSFEGWQNKESLKGFYKRSHFIVLPSQGEGWPKVISEAMAFGVVPVVSDVSSIRQILNDFGVGKVEARFDPEDYASSLQKYLDDPAEWSQQSLKARSAAHAFTFEAWSKKLFSIFTQYWKIKIN